MMIVVGVGMAEKLTGIAPVTKACERRVQRIKGDDEWKKLDSRSPLIRRLLRFEVSLNSLEGICLPAYLTVFIRPFRNSDAS